MERIKVGIQVYSIRDVLAKDPTKFREVMQQLKDMGYDGVELAGLYGLEPAYIRDTLQQIGLEPISAHVPLADMAADVSCLEDYRQIGCTYVAVPYLPQELRHNTPGYAPTLADIAHIGEAAKTYGLQLLYHNHDFEFVPMPDGTPGFDDIFARIPADLLQVEPDTCWIKVAGYDPAGYVRKYSGRCPVVHLKDFVKEGRPANLYQLLGAEDAAEEEGTGFFQFRSVGSGQQDWQPILDAVVDAEAGWVIVEQDESYDIPSMECARRSREYLKSLGW